MFHDTLVRVRCSAVTVGVGESEPTENTGNTSTSPASTRPGLLREIILLVTLFVGYRLARLAIAGLAAGRDGSTQRFATLREVEVRDVDADLVRREATLGSVRLAGGELGLRRDARGNWDVAQLLVERKTPKPEGPPAPWKVGSNTAVLRGMGKRSNADRGTPAIV